MKIVFIVRLHTGILSEIGAKMTRLFKNLQIVKIFFKKKIIKFFKNFGGAQGPPWSLSGSATDRDQESKFCVILIWSKK